jgi:L-fuculose-phosphate aldolase
VSDVAARKRDLLAADHILDMHGQNVRLAGHLTAQLPGGDSFWCQVYGEGFEDVRAADLHHSDIDIDLHVLEGPGRINPSHVIHAGFCRARPDMCCVIHTHSPSSVALSAIGANLKPLFQSALMFEGEIARPRAYGGIVDMEETGEDLARALGTGRALLLVNHGTLLAGRGIREAVHCPIVLDHACRIQRSAMAAAAGAELLEVDATPAADAGQFPLSDEVLALRWNLTLRRALAAKPWLSDELKAFA